jgi:hypothetical protein
MHRRLFAILSVFALSGCYTFQHTSSGELVPGQTVRARVTGAYSDTLSTIMLRDTREFEGEVVQISATTLMVEVTVDAAFQGMRLETLKQRVAVPHDAIVEMETKELSKGRTYLMAGVLATAIGTIIFQQLNKDGGGSTQPGPGGPEDAIIGASSVRRSGFTIPLGFGWFSRR